MPAGSPRPPGWYRDPDDPLSVRHWTGECWSSQRRARPGWDLPDSDWIAPPLPADTGGPVLDGPVRSPGLPAIAAATTHPRRGYPSGAAATTPGFAVPSRRPTRSEQAVPAASWTNRRRPVLVMVGLSLLAVLALVASVALTRPSPAVAWTEDAPQFVADANRLCASALAGVRPAAAPAMTSSAAAPSPAGVEVWATTVARVAQRIRSLPTVPDDTARLNTWLGEWATYSNDEHRYAAWLRANPSAAAAVARTGQQLSDRAAHEAVAADGFAGANGLSRCTLGAAAP